MTTYSPETQALLADIIAGECPVDSITRECCGGIGRHTRDCRADTPLPPGADMACLWEGDPAYRTVFGVDRTVTDSTARVYTAAIQLADGSLDDGSIEAPGLYVCDGERDGLHLNSDQARELASVLLQAAAELDGWVTR